MTFHLHLADCSAHRMHMFFILIKYPGTDHMLTPGVNGFLDTHTITEKVRTDVMDPFNVKTHSLLLYCSSFSVKGRSLLAPLCLKLSTLPAF